MPIKFADFRVPFLRPEIFKLWFEFHWLSCLKPRLPVNDTAAIVCSLLCIYAFNFRQVHCRAHKQLWAQGLTDYEVIVLVKQSLNWAYTIWMARDKMSLHYELTMSLWIELQIAVWYSLDYKLKLNSPWCIFELIPTGWPLMILWPINVLGNRFHESTEKIYVTIARSGV